MRVVTPTKYLIGLIAAGSIVTIFGGSAWAAEAGSSSSAAASDSASVATAHSASLEQGVLTTVGSGNIEAAASNSQDTAAAASSGALLEAQSIQAIANSQAIQPLPSTTLGTSTASTNFVHTDSLPISDMRTQVVPSAVEASLPSAAPAKPAQSAVEASLSAQSSLFSTDESSRTVTFNSRVLVIQPAIIAHTLQLNNYLATFVPSAPLTSHIPLPAKSIGLFSNLTAGLSTTVVPRLIAAGFLTLGVTSLMQIVSNSSVATLVFLSILSFALWLRRSGFQYAARSSLARSSSSSASSFLMGYVPVLPLVHSPFLMVVDMKIASLTFVNIYRKEEVV